MAMKLGLLFVVFFLFNWWGFSQDIVGVWKTLDDNSDEQRSTVEIYQEEDGKYYGRITSITREEERDDLCSLCEGEKYNQLVLGMIIIEGLFKDDDEYSDGTILDPENGEVYDCTLWLNESGDLIVRGYWGFFYRTQTWKKINY